MFFHICRAIFMPLVLMLAACSAASPLATTSGGGVEGSARDVTAGTMIFRKLSVHPDAGAPPLLMNFVANGPNQGGVPCIGCVNGATTNDTIGLTGPSSYVLSNTYWQYAISFTDISYKGKCKLSWSITSGKKTIDSFSASINLTSSGGYIVYALARSRPKYSGSATLTGGYACGKNKGSAQAPLYFQ